MVMAVRPSFANFLFFTEKDSKTPTATSSSVVSVPVSLVKEARVNLSGDGNARRVGAEDLKLHKSHERVVHGESLLHWELWRNDGRNDEDAMQEELVF